jgi:hypothetical protein
MEMENKKLDLIDRGELVRLYNLWIGQLQAPEDAGDLNGVEACLAVLLDQHTADAVEVIHSVWTLNKDGSGTCQNCHRTTKNAWDYDSCFRYCPDCGARMDGDTK